MFGIAFRYLSFAAIATAVNLLVQWPIFQWLHGETGLYLALFVGTLSGLVVKYLLDKRWIFNYQTKSHRDNLSRFGLYSFMGVFTTAIFWGFEMVFYYWIDFLGAQYFGGALGLLLGYIVKYFLDKRFVFKVEA